MNGFVLIGWEIGSWGPGELGFAEVKGDVGGGEVRGEAMEGFYQEVDGGNDPRVVDVTEEVSHVIIAFAFLVRFLQPNGETERPQNTPLLDSDFRGEGVANSAAVVENDEGRRRAIRDVKEVVKRGELRVAEDLG